MMEEKIDGEKIQKKMNKKNKIDNVEEFLKKGRYSNETSYNVEDEFRRDMRSLKKNVFNSRMDRRISIFTIIIFPIFLLFYFLSGAFEYLFGATFFFLFSCISELYYQVESREVKKLIRKWRSVMVSFPKEKSETPDKYTDRIINRIKKDKLK